MYCGGSHSGVKYGNTLGEPEGPWPCKKIGWVDKNALKYETVLTSDSTADLAPQKLCRGVSYEKTSVHNFIKID